MKQVVAGQPLTLQCGLTLPNRLAKAAMAENMAGQNGLPNEAFHSPYGAWAEGGWGLVITGNVQVNMKYLGGAGDVALNESVQYDQQLEAWKAWAKACNCPSTPTIVQINHPGRQSPLGAGKRGFMDKNLAPSALPTRLGRGIVPWALNSLVFGTPREMSVEEIQEVVRQFVATARLACEAGFAGVELHGAHGYLLTQFLSSESNKRTDAYGGSPAARAKIVLDIVKAIRTATPSNFCIGVKFNSVDLSSAELQDCVEQLKLIVATGVDFVEVSGGSLENPTMALGVTGQGQKSDHTKAREAFFLEFASAVRHDLSNVPLMVTGGFRSRHGIEKAISIGDCDLVGLGRPAVLNPALPKEIILNPKVQDSSAEFNIPQIHISRILKLLGIKIIGAGANSKWYGGRIRKLRKAERVH